MIVDIITITIVSFLSLIGGLLNLIAFILPNEFQQSLISLLSNLKYFDGLVPVADLLNVFTTIITFWAFLFLIRILLKFWGAVPFFGKRVDV